MKSQAPEPESRKPAPKNTEEELIDILRMTSIFYLPERKKEPGSDQEYELIAF